MIALMLSASGRASRVVPVLAAALIGLWAMSSVGAGSSGRFTVVLTDQAGDALRSGAALPARFSDDAVGTPDTPGVRWMNVPIGVNRLALAVRDMSLGGAVHSFIYNINPLEPIRFNELRDAQAGQPTFAFRTGVNDFAEDAPVFRAPGPPEGSTHTYEVTLYAMQGPPLPPALTHAAFLPYASRWIKGKTSFRFTYRSQGLGIELLGMDDRAFSRGASLPVTFSPYAGGVPETPAIAWTGVSEAADFMVLSVENASLGNAVHSLIYNLSPSQPIDFNEIAEQQVIGAPFPFGVGVNAHAARFPVFAPPLTPQGSRHRFVYTLYSVVGPPLPDGLTLNQVKVAIADRVLHQTSTSVQFSPPPFKASVRNAVGQDFARGASLPVSFSEYSNAGRALSPEIFWQFPPLEVTSMAVLVTDETAGNLVHSLVYNIDPATPIAFDRLAADQAAGGPFAYTVGVNSFADVAPVYFAPEPPIRQRHKYVFTVVGITGAPLPAGLNASEFNAAVQGRVAARFSTFVFFRVP
jgi:phosphatidylethanolamine-binding protein (PEBP) family uncharacterized protein